MATTNYKFEKRQRDLAKKKKHDEKLQKKLEKKQAPTTSNPAPEIDSTNNPGDSV